MEGPGSHSQLSAAAVRCLVRGETSGEQWGESHRTDRMRLVVSVLVAVFSVSVLGGRVRREQDCEEVNTVYTQCTTQDYADYRAAHEAGDDGEPDWVARKSCNYLTSAVENCGNGLLGDCHSEDDVNARKDSQVQGILKQLEATLDTWDSDKCPPVQAYLERQ